jgi:hypothetical protein
MHAAKLINHTIDIELTSRIIVFRPTGDFPGPSVVLCVCAAYPRLSAPMRSVVWALGGPHMPALPIEAGCADVLGSLDPRWSSWVLGGIGLKGFPLANFL